MWVITRWNTRLYTHQGASVGFHLGYFVIFMIGLLRYNLGIKPAIWAELVAIVFPLLLGYASARLIPHNLLLAYKRLKLADGAIFFIFLLVGPAWGYFFFENYSLLLDQTVGTFLFLLAATLLIAHTVWKSRRKDKESEQEASP